jgi:hypothetical protein
MCAVSSVLFFFALAATPSLGFVAHLRTGGIHSYGGCPVLRKADCPQRCFRPILLMSEDAPKKQPPGIDPKTVRVG